MSNCSVVLGLVGNTSYKGLEFFDFIVAKNL